MANLRAALAMFVVSLASAAHSADEPPVIPVGLDAYRQWDRWAQQRIGVRAYMRSTYDRLGGNQGADSSHFLYQLADDNNVTLDIDGPPGILYFVRTNHWHGSPWRYTVDGTEHIVQESNTADPTKRVGKSTFLPEDLFPTPLTFTWTTTMGADLMWVPIGFNEKFRLGYTRTCYGTGYYIYHLFDPAVKTSQPLKAWDGKTPPDKDVLDLLTKSGTDLLAGSADLQEKSGTVSVPAKGTVNLVEVAGAHSIRTIQFSIPQAQAVAAKNLRLRTTWDGRAQPSVDAPLPLFFGAGTLYNRSNKEFLVKAFPVNIQTAGERVNLRCFFPMPFFKSARIELVNGSETAFSDIQWSIRTTPYAGPKNHVGYFHATYRDIPDPAMGHDMVLLDTREVEGGGDWSGSFVGTSFIFSHKNNLGTLEGDPRFFFDDSQSPQAYGTGTEEWGGGGDYWGGRTMTLPLAGHPVGANDKKNAKEDEDQIQSAYRFLLADLMPFGKNAVIRLEHGPENNAKEHYETVTFWYGLPGASLVKTDEVDIGDLESEKAHAYASPDATEPVALESRYEWGPDKYGTTVIYPALKDTGRSTKTMSEFTLKLTPKNLGALLRRKLDYAFPNQRAEVYIADASDPAKALTDADFKRAGVWYLAGSNTCVYSRPNKELDPPQHIVRTSNRRFRDDEFIVSRALTEGRSAIRVRVKFTPVAIPLFPGHPVPDLAWSELHYTAYSIVMPPAPE